MAQQHGGGDQKLWGGRFTGKTDPVMVQFNDSLPFDKAMWRQDIAGSKAYSNATAKVGIISTAERDELHRGLDKVHDLWQTGKFEIKPGDEDIHTANERCLGEIISKDIAGKLHTGRSRNDQVATDVRLWLRDEIDDLLRLVKTLLQVALKRAESEIDIIMPGYTHLQRAQPIRWSHWLMAYCQAWFRDYQRLEDCRKRLNLCPLGSSALAGTPFGIDRDALAVELGFEGATENSLDSVSDRDFVAEFLFDLTMVMTHLSKFAEDLILYTTAEFNFVSLSDAYSTGSSLMPQKKNPDSLELLRGKVARVLGSLNTMLVILKGIPSTYNKDMQEDKEPLFDAVRTVHGCLNIANGVLSTLTTKPDVMRSAVTPDMLATDLADYLVRKGVPFRTTHHIVGAAVKLAESKKVPLSGLTLDELRGLCDKFESDVNKVWDVEQSVERRNARGGCAKASVLAQIQNLSTKLGL